MTELVAISFDDEMKADEAALAAARLGRAGKLEIEDLAVVVKNTRGKVKVRQTVDVTPGQGAAAGSFWGLFVGILLGGPLGGALWGAGAGALWGKLVDLGVDEGFMKDLAERLEPGSSALFTLVRAVEPDAVLDEMRRFDGHVLHTSLPDDAERAVHDALEASSVTA